MELEEITATYNRDGIAGVNDFIDQRGKRFNLTQYAYMLVDENNSKLAGDLDEWPGFREYGDGWLSFELGILQRDGDSREWDFVARSTHLADGNSLLVARSYERVLGYIQFVAGVLLRGFIVTVSMGVVGALNVSVAAAVSRSSNCSGSSPTRARTVAGCMPSRTPAAAA